MTNAAGASRLTSRCWSSLTWIASIGGILITIILQMQLGSAAFRVFPTPIAENEPCTLDGTHGTCRPYATCWEEIGSNIHICDRTANRAVVCCPNSTSNSEPSQQRKSSQKCSEYRKLGRKLPSVERMCEYTGRKVIAGGIHALSSEFPHMAALGWRKASDDTIFFSCGGSLISKRFILTAAHCLVRIEGAFPSFVRLGEVYLLRHNDEMQHDDYEIEAYFPHPNFKRRHGKYNDIALLKLAKDVFFGTRIRPACLYGEETSPSKRVLATGYGSQAYYEDFSNELVKASLEMYDNKRCDEKYAGTRALPLGMTDGQLCAGGRISGHDTCPGDSGGPLLVTDQENDCVFVVFGIISFGSYCGGINPAIYTRVAAYLDWIEGIVWP